MTPDYIVLCWNDGDAEVLVRGHVDLETYRRALVAEGHDYDVDDVEHIFGRWRPRGRDDADYLDQVDGPAPGAGRFTIRRIP